MIVFYIYPHINIYDTFHCFSSSKFLLEGISLTEWRTFFISSHVGLLAGSEFSHLLI